MPILAVVYLLFKSVLRTWGALKDTILSPGYRVGPTCSWFIKRRLSTIFMELD